MADFFSKDSPAYDLSSTLSYTGYPELCGVPRVTLELCGVPQIKWGTLSYSRVMRGTSN